MSNSSSNQQRNPQPPGSTPHAYSTSPTQLSMSSDIASVGLQNPYHGGYTYAQNPHDQPAFAFPGQPQQYRPQQLQAQQLPLPSHHHQHHHPSLSQQSPGPRKRRASDLNESIPGSLPGSASSNTSGYGIAHNLVPGPSELEVGIGQGPPQPQLPSPVAKKGRTNTPWTPAEEQRLKTLRDAGSSWSEIAKTFPTRTEGSVKKHWYKDMHYAEFAEDEVSSFSAALLQAIKDYENNKWKVIGQKVGKPAKACEQFAKEQGWKV